MSVKSSVRTLQVFEYLEHVRRPVSVHELSTEFGWPASSTSVLLKSLCEHGYLHRIGTMVSPTMRFPVLGSWIRAGQYDGFQLANFVIRVREEIGFTAVLSMRTGLYSHYLYLRLAPMQRKGVVSKHPKPGARRALCGCAAGVALMSTLDDREVGLIIRNSIGVFGQSVDGPAVLREIQSARECGYAWQNNRSKLGIGDIAVPLPVADSFGNVLILSLGVPHTVLATDHPALGKALQRYAHEFAPAV